MQRSLNGAVARSAFHSLHIHKDRTDATDLHAALREFVTASDTRKSLFGAI